MGMKIGAAIGAKNANATCTLVQGVRTVGCKNADKFGYVEFNNLEPLEYVLRTPIGEAYADCRKGSVLNIKTFTAASVNPPAPGQTADPAATAIKIDRPFSGPNVLIENMIIDASGVDRVIAHQQNQVVTVRNCTILNPLSIYEGNSSGSTIRFENVTCPLAGRYMIYLESKGRDGLPIFNTAANRVEIVKCNFGSSKWETPVRLMYGVDAGIAESTIMDTLDEGSNKANQGLRLHCYSAYLTGSMIGLWTKMGWGTDLDPKHFTQSVNAVDCNFIGGIRTEGLFSLFLKNCLLNGTKGKSGYAIGPTEGYSIPEKLSISADTLFVGKFNPAFRK